MAIGAPNLGVGQTEREGPDLVQRARRAILRATSAA
jgi:hypothetical protein